MLMFQAGLEEHMLWVPITGTYILKNFGKVYIRAHKNRLSDAVILNTTHRCILKYPMKTR